MLQWFKNLSFWQFLTVLAAANVLMYLGSWGIQEHVVRTLSNAIEQGRVHHAYLFVGSRGTGKTSMAKILAASLNCANGGPTVTATRGAGSP